MDKSMTLKPRQSEKTYALSQTGVYVFDVPKTANKMQVADAVKAQFDVTVVTVRIVIAKGKPARSIRIGSRSRSNVSGMRSDVKKAYVTLKDGDSIPVFAALDEQQEKIAKAEEKAAKKAKKTKKDEK
jgi:large subunit ribosomal protein L23